MTTYPSDAMKDKVEERIRRELGEAMGILSIDRMPSQPELKSIGFGGLASLIQRNGGNTYWADKLGLEMKLKAQKKETFKRYETEIPAIIQDVMEKLKISRMPSMHEIVDILGKTEGGTISANIIKTGGFRFWAKKLKLVLKDTETKQGNDYEYHAKKILEEKGHKVEKMPTCYPFDLLVDGCVKIDVKTSRFHMSGNVGRHSFTTQRDSECHLYVMFGLDEQGSCVEKELIIPSKDANVVTISVAENGGKYDQYQDRWDLVKEYSKLFKSKEESVL